MSDGMDRIGMAILADEASSYKKKIPTPKPRPQSIVEAAKRRKKVAPKRKKITAEDIERGLVSPGDANDEMMIPAFKNGGMIDRKAVRGKTRGKIC